jgi:hypothetical protein
MAKRARIKYTAVLRDADEDTSPVLVLDSKPGSPSATLLALRRSALARSDNEIKMERMDGIGLV